MRNQRTNHLFCVRHQPNADEEGKRAANPPVKKQGRRATIRHLKEPSLAAKPAATPPTVRRSRHQLAPSSAVLTATTPKNRAHLRPPTSAQRWSADAAYIPELHVAMTLPEAWLPPHLLCSQRQQPTASLLRQKTSDTVPSGLMAEKPPPSQRLHDQTHHLERAGQ
nr:hypothetical protein Iba_chr03cCG1240 [Ipomoea batatas]